jgi:hypothetical protein
MRKFTDVLEEYLDERDKHGNSYYENPYSYVSSCERISELKEELNTMFGKLSDTTKVMIRSDL